MLQQRRSGTTCPTSTQKEAACLGLQMGREGLVNGDNGVFNGHMGDGPDPQDPNTSVRVEIVRNYPKLEPERAT